MAGYGAAAESHEPRASALPREDHSYPSQREQEAQKWQTYIAESWERAQSENQWYAQQLARLEKTVRTQQIELEACRRNAVATETMSQSTSKAARLLRSTKSRPQWLQTSW